MRRFLIGTLALLLTLAGRLPVRAQEPEETPQPTPTVAPEPALIWSGAVNLSNTPDSSWFPDLAIDSRDDVHVVWCETTQLEGGGEKEQVFYIKGDGVRWSAPNDIVAPSPNIIRHAIAVDRSDRLHLAYGHPSGSGLGLFNASASANDGWSAANWTPPRIANVRGLSYATDLEIDSQGTLHLIFDDRGNQGTEKCPMCADIFYRRSTDGGQTWGSPVVLSNTPTGSSRAQMEVGADGVVHVTWDEGWDRISGRGAPQFSMYTFSNDGGLTWADPLTISQPVTGTAQLTPGADHRGGVMLVWRTVSNLNLYYQWSQDGGLTWTAPNVIPTLLARPWSTPFDAYDMAADSQGRIHLVAVGSEPDDPAAALGVYHLEWDGQQWSQAQPIFVGAGLPEYPRIQVSRGNRLHAVWFVRDDLILRGNYEVWYGVAESQAPAQSPLPTFTPPPTPTTSPAPTLTPQSSLLYGDTLPPGAPSGALPSGNLYTDHDDVLQLALALSPLALLVGGIWALRRGWLRRWR